jgi:hypothetical protein
VPRAYGPLNPALDLDGGDVVRREEKGKKHGAYSGTKCRSVNPVAVTVGGGIFALQPFLSLMFHLSSNHS